MLCKRERSRHHHEQNSEMDHSVISNAGPATGAAELRLRARAGRSGGHLESVGPFDELDRDDESDREGDRVEAMVDESVGVAA
jgi:hypothetical protein